MNRRTDKPIAIIVAIAENNAIGLNNKLLWHIKDDMKRFKKITSGHTVIMGKRTFESLPIRPLPNRRNIVLTDQPDEKIEGCSMAYTIDDILNQCDPNQVNFVIGGASVYRQLMPLADRLLITRVHEDFEGDVFFPEIDRSEWDLVHSEPGPPDPENRFDYTYEEFRRKR